MNLKLEPKFRLSDKIFADTISKETHNDIGYRFSAKLFVEELFFSKHKSLFPTFFGALLKI